MKMREVIGTSFEILSPLLPAPTASNSSWPVCEGCLHILFLEFYSLLQEWAIREN